MNIILTLKILLIITVAFLFVTSADDFLDKLFVQLLGLQSNSILTSFIILLIALGLLFLVLYWFEIEAHHVFGIEDSITKLL
jgi:hypothetical protein